MSTSLAAKIVAAIHRGKLDKSLPAIASAVRSRSAALVEIRAASISTGDTVVFCHTGKPNYLRGKTAVVLERLSDGRYDFLVEIKSFTGGKYSAGSKVRVAASMIKKEGE